MSSKQEFAILTYHRIQQPDVGRLVAGHVDANIVTPMEEFEFHIKELARGANVLHLETALTLTKNSMLPKHAVVLTFDDGFAEHFNYVYGALRKHELPATFFVTGHSLCRNMGLRWLEWYYLLQEKEGSRSPVGSRKITTELKCLLKAINHAERTLLLEKYSNELKLSREERKEMQATLFGNIESICSIRQSKLVRFGGHTMTHGYLSKLDEVDRKSEIGESACRLKEILGAQYPFAFAYPFGDHGSYNSQCSRDVMNLGYYCACTSEPGFNNISTPQFELKRFDMCHNNLDEILASLS